MTELLSAPLQPRLDAGALLGRRSTNTGEERMMTRIAIAALVAAWALIGCGGQLGDDEGDDVGSLEQGSVIDANDYGWMALGSGAGNVRCLIVNNASNCYLPTDKVVKYKVTGTNMSATQKADIEALVDGSIVRLAGDYPGWTISRVTSGTADVNIGFATSNPATNKNSIHTYVYGSPVGLTAQNDFGSTGTYNKFASVSCDISHGNIVRDFIVSQQPKVKAHAVDICFGLGVGTGSGGVTTRPHAIAVTPNALKSDAPSQRNKCLAQNYDPVGNDLLVRTLVEGLALCTGTQDN